MQKICYVDEDGRFGGPQQRMLIVADELKKHNINVEFLIPNNEVELFKIKLQEKKLHYQQINLTRLSLRPIYLIKYIFFFIFEVLQLIKLFKKKKYSIIQANSTPHFKAIIAAAFLKIDSVWVIEDSYFPEIIVFIFRSLAKISNCRIVYTSQKVKEFYFDKRSELKNHKVEIFAPADIKKFDVNLKHSLPDYISKNKIIITTVAGIVPVKGIEYFIKAADILVTKYDKVEFLIAGAKITSQTKYSKKIDKLLKNKNYIKYLGMVENVAQLLRYSDVFVCSSISEAGPITVYEAMLMKKPVVTTNVGAVSQIINNNNNGLIVPVKNSEEIAMAIEKLIFDKQLRENIANNALNFSKEFFSLKKIIDKYKQVYNFSK